nr:hypothetical protein [Tanacetum cinerariifolium]
MVINSPCLTNKKELAIPGQMATGKELSNPLMAGSLPKTTLPTKLKKHKPKRKHTKEPEVPPTESQAEHNVPFPLPFHNPLPSGEDSLKLKELMDLCIKLSNKVIDLENEVIDIKSTHKANIKKLESKVKRLEEENRGRKIAVIDADVEINLEKVQAGAYNLDLDYQKKINRYSNEISSSKENTFDISSSQEEYDSLFKEHGIKIPEKEVRQEKEVKVESSKREGESLEQEITKKQKIEQETVELKKHLQIVPDDDHDVYADATPLASKIPIVDYKIHIERNKPYFKINRADGNHTLFMNFSTMMKSFEREDLESLWKIIKERFKKTEPKNYIDDFLLNTLKIMFENPNVKGNKMYPLTHFTMEQMVNDVRLEVDYESEMSLKLLRLVRRQLNEGYVSQ